MLFLATWFAFLTSSSNRNTPSESETHNQGQGREAPHKHYQELLTCSDFPKALGPDSIQTKPKNKKAK